jgi:hypothetical protein
LRYNAFNGIEWSFQMKDLGFNEFGELQNSSGQIDEETSGMQTEMTGINSSLVADDDGEEEAENTEIAI